MWATEPRAKDTSGTEYRDCELYTKAHKDYSHKGAAFMSAPCGPAVAKEYGIPENQILCACLAPRPTRAHWAFECESCGPVRPGRDDVMETEKRLGTPIVPRIKHHMDIHHNGDDRVRHVAARMCRQHSRFIFACDGGAMGVDFGERRAAYGIGVDGMSYGGPLPGLDHTCGAAEVWALLMLLRSTKGIHGEMEIIIDNLNVWKQAHARVQERNIPVRQELGGIWAEIDALIGKRTARTRVYWIPSHDKGQDTWQAPDPLDMQLFRDLNKLADEGATKALQVTTNQIQSMLDTRQLAWTRAKETHRRVAMGSDELRVRFPRKPWQSAKQRASRGARAAGAGTQSDGHGFRTSVAKARAGRRAKPKAKAKATSSEARACRSAAPKAKAKAKSTDEQPCHQRRSSSTDSRRTTTWRRDEGS